MILRKASEINLPLLRLDCKEINANYLIHKKGVVISNKTNKILKPAKLKNGYLAVAIERKTTYIHKIGAGNTLIPKGGWVVYTSKGNYSVRPKNE